MQRGHAAIDGFDECRQLGAARVQQHRVLQKADGPIPTNARELSEARGGKVS